MGSPTVDADVNCGPNRQRRRQPGRGNSRRGLRPGPDRADRLGSKSSAGCVRQLQDRLQGVLAPIRGGRFGRRDHFFFPVVYCDDVLLGRTGPGRPWVASLRRIADAIRDCCSSSAKRSRACSSGPGAPPSRASDGHAQGAHLLDPRHGARPADRLLRGGPRRGIEQAARDLADREMRGRADGRLMGRSAATTDSTAGGRRTTGGSVLTAAWAPSTPNGRPQPLGDAVGTPKRVNPKPFPGGLTWPSKPTLLEQYAASGSADEVAGALATGTRSPTWWRSWWGRAHGRRSWRRSRPRHSTRRTAPR